MVSFSICISPTLTLQYLSSRRALIILRIVASAVCTLVNSPRFSANFAAASQTRSLSLPCRKIAAGYSAISIIDVNIFFFFSPALNIDLHARNLSRCRNLSRTQFSHEFSQNTADSVFDGKVLDENFYTTFIYVFFSLISLYLFDVF